MTYGYKSALPRLRSLALALHAAWGLSAFALPQGATVVNGQVQIAQPNAGAMQIKASNGAIINWRQFSIGSGESAQFVQPGSTSAVLNRVVGRDLSELMGQLKSNGQVFLINPNGVLVGPGGQVLTHGFLASTLDVANDDFLRGGPLRLQGGGRTVVHVARGGRLIGLIAIADAVRPTSRATIAKLQERGVKVAMITGDNQATAERIGKELGIDIVLADVLPGEKASKIKELQAQGHKVAMVGDGINDAPALTQADVGFAIGAGTDVAMESAQVVLMKSDPYDVVGAIELSRATLRKMHQNLGWAVAYNVLAFPLAAGVFYPFTLSPEVAALSMSGSSAIVAINALMLKRTKLAGIRSPHPAPAASSSVAQGASA